MVDGPKKAAFARHTGLMHTATHRDLVRPAGAQMRQKQQHGKEGVCTMSNPKPKSYFPGIPVGGEKLVFSDRVTLGISITLEGTSLVEEQCLCGVVCGCVWVCMKV